MGEPLLKDSEHIEGGNLRPWPDLELNPQGSGQENRERPVFDVLYPQLDEEERQRRVTHSVGFDKNTPRPTDIMGPEDPDVTRFEPELVEPPLGTSEDLLGFVSEESPDIDRDYRERKSTQDEAPDPLADFMPNKELSHTPTEASVELPSAVDLAMKKTEGLTSEATSNVPEVHLEVDESLERELDTARSEYANLLTAWKKERKEKSGKFAKMMSDLGSDKKLTELDEPRELVEARETYEKAKRAKSSKLFEKIKTVPNKDQKPLGLMEAEMQANREAFFAVVENERNALNNAVTEGMPDFYKRALDKGIKVWEKLPASAQKVITNRWLRLGVSATLMSGVAFIFGLTAAGVGMGSFAAHRVARSIAGGAVSTGVGRISDYATNRININKRSEFLSPENVQFSPENLEATEKNIEQFLDQEKARKFKQRIGKVGAMIATAGATAVGTNYLESLVQGNIPSANLGLSHNLDKVATTKPLDVPPDFGNVDHHLEKLDMAREGVVKDAVPAVLETKVDLSSHGFIQDFHELKANIMSEYYGKEMPPVLKENIMNKTPTELAKQFGFYDPTTNASGVGFKGESLGIDSSGDLYYTHLDGSRQIIFDAKTGEIHKFAGEMTSPDIALDSNESVSPAVEEVPAKDDVPITPGLRADSDPDVVKVREMPTEEEVVLTDETKFKVAPPINESMVSSPNVKVPVEGGKFVDVMDVGGKREVMFEGLPIGHESNGVLVLEDKFQDGPNNANIRSAFAKTFESVMKDNVLGPKPIAESFEGGKIYVSFGVPSDPEKVRVLLNGKEIAVGNLVDGLPKLKMNSGLGSKWFLSPNVYDRALKHIEKAIKAGSYNFKI